MKNKVMKRSLCLFLALVLTLSLAPQVTAGTSSPLSITDFPDLEKSGDAQMIIVDVSAESAFVLQRAKATVSLSGPSGASIVATAKGTRLTNAEQDIFNPITTNFEGTSEGFTAIVGKDTGLPFSVGDNFVRIGVQIAANATGTWTLTITFDSDPGNTDITPAPTAPLTSTITVTDPSASEPPAAPYELYYTLDSTTDTETPDPDKFMEYAEVGDTVTARVFLRATSSEAAAKNLQAFDLYVENDPALDRTGATCPEVDGNVIGALIDNDLYAQTSTDTLTHIQAIGTDTEKPINVDIPEGSVGVLIATIEYEITNAAVYNVGMPITIKADSNIAVQDTPASFTPDRGSDILGAEVLQTWTVTYKNGVGDSDQSDADAGVTGMPVPATQTKEQNVALTLTGTVTGGAGVPSRTGYTFLGWDTTRNETSTPLDYPVQAAGSEQRVMAADVNQDVTLYAQWSQDRYTVVWYNNYKEGENKVLETDANEYTYDEAPEYNGTEPTRADTTEHSYVFSGWNEDPDAAYTDAIAEADLPGVTKDTSYYAIFRETARMYPVHYHLNGHGSGSIADQSVAYNTTTTAPTTAPTDTNYDFDGWYKEAECTNEWDFANDKVTKETDLYAKWTAKSFTLNLIENGGTYVSPYTEPTTYTYGAQDNLPTAAQITRPGYTFAGWYATSGLTGSAVTQVPADATGTQTYYAKWTPLTYKVAFNANGAQTGSTAGMDPVTFGTPQALTENGFTYTYTVGGQTKSYTFSGWSETAKAIGAAADYPANSTTAVTDAIFTRDNLAAGSTITLYATWSQDDYAITYVLGENGVNGTNNPPTYNVDHLPITLNDPTRPGYTFDGWTATKTGSGESVVLTDGDTIPDGTTGDLTLTAAWQKISYKITFVEDGGSSVGDANHQMSYDIESENTLPVTTRTGYTFQHWLLTDGGSVAQNWGIVNTATPAEEASVKGKYGNVELTAIWQAKTADLTFDPKQDNDHVGTLPDDTTNPIEVTYDDEYPSLPVPTPPIGYDFDGWYVGGVKIEAGGTVAIYEDATAVAHYTAHPYTITYVEDGGSDVANGTYTIVDTSVTFPSTSKTNYDFLGWKVTATSDVNGWTSTWTLDDVYGPDDLTKTLSNDHGNVTLTAQWQLHQYTITYNMNGGAWATDYTAPDKYTYGSTTTLPTAVNIKKAGYTFGGWYANLALTDDAVTSIGSTESGDKVYWAKWTKTPYTITLVLDGGTVAGNVTSISYDIETAFTLPTPEKTNFRFDGWLLTANDEDCEAWGTVGTTTFTAATYNANNVKSYYGNVTLTAQWSATITADVEVYKYADTNYVMLRVKDDLNAGKSYKFNNVDMYWTDDANYKFAAGDDGVFYTLIPVASYVSNYDENDPTSVLSLTDAGYAMISSGDNTGAERATITYDGDVNGDGVVNIADANAVYQMVRSTGSYYTGQLETAQRLAADMDKSTSNASYRGSIADVNEIVDKINGKNS